MPEIPIKSVVSTLIVLSAIAYLSDTAIAQAPPMSYGTYKLPYEAGKSVQTNFDHLTHVPTNKVDFGAVSGSAPHAIVAAADGFVRHIRDSFSVQTGAGANPCNDNYLWIEHANGEWTGYFHMQQNSSTVKAGLTVGEFVTKGTYIGDEGSVGCSTGSHLHFEVATPTSGINLTTGLPNNNPGGNALNLVPKICELNGAPAVAGQVYTAN